MRSKLFIGSSKEELSLARLAKSLLDKDFDVTIWDEKIWDASIFKLNQNFLSDLLKATLLYDFGILIGTSDDEVVFRDNVRLQPRDNILFELGLFMGRMGTSKCAFLVENDIKLLSDFQGITLAKFDAGDTHSFKYAVSQIRDLFLSCDGDEINFFPSATLAAVYFENLIVPICRYVADNHGFVMEDIQYRKCKVRVIIPHRITGDVNMQFDRIKSSIVTKNVTFQYAGRPRVISVDTQTRNDTIEFIEFPTILAGINYAISNLLPYDFIKLSPDYSLILERELRRFITTLKRLIIKSGFENMVVIESEEEL